MAPYFFLPFTPALCPQRARYQVSHQYKTADNLIVLYILSLGF